MSDRALSHLDWNARDLFDEYGIPSQFWGGLERYLKAGIRPGGYLSAIITNNLREAHLRAADYDAEMAIGVIVRFLVRECGDNVHGSPAALEAWISRRHNAEARR